MKVLWMVVITAVFVRVSMAETSMKNVEELKKQAYSTLNSYETIGQPSGDSASDYINGLVKAGQTDEAIQYLDRKLLSSPGQLDYQILYAKLLKNQGKDKLAREKASLVCQYAETDDLINQANQILGNENIADFPAISKISGNDNCVVVVPMQGCDQWLVSRMTNELSSALDIPVYVQTIDVEYPKATRSAYDEALLKLRAKIHAQMSNPLAVMLMQQYGYTEKDFESDEKLIAITKKTIAMQNPVAAENFLNEIERLKSEGTQWDAKILKAVLFNSVKTYSRDGVIYIGITPVDIYSDNRAYVLGSADKFGGVVSYYRFTSAFAKDIPKQNRLLKRTKMQCLVSIGDAVGIVGCSNPICARAYPKSLAQYDAKSGELCDRCSSAFKRKFEK